MGNDIDSGPAISVVYVLQTDLDNIFSDTFSLFQLESKGYWTKQCWPYIGYHIDFFWEILLNRMRTIITRGLYTFTHFLKSKNVFSRGFFLKILALCMVSIQEWFLKVS